MLLKDNGVKARIIKQYLPLINKHTNVFLNAMNFFVSFHIDEEFNESIKSRGRDDFSYENFSEGEKQRIDLALLFTWRTIAKMKNSVNTNLLIMDEVLDSYLDTSATENVLALLNSDMFRDTNIFVISHKETISDKFQKTIRFTKNKNFSNIN
jgi:ABC-type dipeptide/oligopeptide/nickel transport system ATPase subunit